MCLRRHRLRWASHGVPHRCVATDWSAALLVGALRQHRRCRHVRCAPDVSQHDRIALPRLRSTTRCTRAGARGRSVGPARHLPAAPPSDLTTAGATRSPRLSSQAAARSSALCVRARLPATRCLSRPLRRRAPYVPALADCRIGSFLLTMSFAGTALFKGGSSAVLSSLRRLRICIEGFSYTLLSCSRSGLNVGTVPDPVPRG